MHQQRHKEPTSESVADQIQLGSGNPDSTLAKEAPPPAVEENAKLDISQNGGAGSIYIYIYIYIFVYPYISTPHGWGLSYTLLQKIPEPGGPRSALFEGLTTIH